MSEWQPADQRELFAAIDALIAGDLDEAAVERLEALLRDNETARLRYVERLNLHAALHWRRTDEKLPGLNEDVSERAVSPPPVAPAPGSTPLFGPLVAWAGRAVEFARRPTPASMLVATIATPLLLVALLYIVAPSALNVGRNAGAPESSRAPAATLVRTLDARWPTTADAIPDGTVLTQGRAVRLDAGVAEILFENGATVLLRGPAEFSIERSDQCRLELGALTADVPRRGRGFTVLTETASIVDLGTRFRARVTADGEASVLVDSGTVELRALADDSHTVRLTAGQSARVGAVGAVARLDAGDRADIGPLADLPEHLPTIERPLVNGGFERKIDTRSPNPRQPGAWHGEPSRIVGSEKGVVPFEGTRMLRFLHADARGAGKTGGAEIRQAIDLSPYADAVAEGRLHARATARFNRVAGDRQTDTEFRLVLFALRKPLTGTREDHGGSSVTSVDFQKIDTDADPATWEAVTVTGTPPVGTQMLMVQVHAGENVFNDVRGTEFDGHYADAVQLDLLIDPPAAGDDVPQDNAAENAK